MIPAGDSPWLGAWGLGWGQTSGYVLLSKSIFMLAGLFTGTYYINKQTSKSIAHQGLWLMAFSEPGLRERGKVGLGNRKTWLLPPSSFQRDNSKSQNQKPCHCPLLSVSFHAGKTRFGDQVVFEPFY